MRKGPFPRQQDSHHALSATQEEPAMVRDRLTACECRKKRAQILVARGLETHRSKMRTHPWLHTSPRACDRLCPAGRMLSGAPSACTACAAGTYSQIGKDCGDCPAGSFPDSSASRCISCPAGSFAIASVIVDVSGCMDCPRGRYSTVPGISDVDKW